MGKNAVKWPLGVSQQTGDVKQTDYGSNELKIKYRRLFVQTLESAIQRINHYSVDKY